MHCFIFFYKKQFSNKTLVLHNEIIIATKRFFSPAFFIFALFSIAMLYYCDGLHLTTHDYDSFHQWALEPKMLFVNDGFVHSNGEYIGSYVNYLQGFPLLLWFGLHVSGAFSEFTLFFVQFLLYGALILPVFNKISWKTAYLIPIATGIALILPQALNPETAARLFTDNLLGFCFANSLICVYQLKEKDSFYLSFLGLNLFALCLIKSYGLLFIAYVFVFYLLMGSYKKQNKLATTIIFLLPFVMYGIWRVFCIYTGRIGFHDNINNNLIQSILQGTYSIPITIKSICKSMYYAVLAPNATEAILPVSLFIWSILPPVLFLILFFVTKKSHYKKITIEMIVTNIFIVAMLFVSMITIFLFDIKRITIHDIMRVTLCRYLAPSMIGFVCFSLWLLIKETSKAHKLSLYCISLFLLTSLSIDWNYIIENKNSIKESPTLESELSEICTIPSYLIQENNETRILSVYINEYLLIKLRYFNYPAKFIELPHNIENVDMFKNFIRDNNITHILPLASENNSIYKFGSLDDLLLQINPNATPIEYNFVYEVIFENNDLYLLPT